CAGSRVSDTDAAANSRIETVTAAGDAVDSDVGSTVARLRIGHVDGVRLLVDEDPARPPELEPLRDELAVVVENLHPVVLTIAHEDAAARVERDGVWDIEFARAHPFFPPGLDELAGFIELHDPRVSDGGAAAVMAVRHVQVAVISHRDFGRLVELIVPGA